VPTTLSNSAAAFAPGRVNVIGEHTDYNDGLALAFAIGAGVTVRARRCDGRGAFVRASALDLDERDEFPLEDPARPEDGGWRAYVRGVAAELQRSGASLPPISLEIESNLPRGAGLSSSAALTVALCLALLTLGGAERAARIGKLEIARLCARVERDWAGAETGLLDQLASLFGASDTAVLIDFATVEVEPIGLELEGWRFALLDSGERHALGDAGGYNKRRAECRRACELLGVRSLREADRGGLSRLPETLARRTRHVLEENERVGLAVAALRARDPARLGQLLDASHASLRDLYEVSTPAVERAVEAMRERGAAGARIMGGGFGGAVLGLLPPDAAGPPEALTVTAGAGAHLL
jgi:galactokinase